MKKRKWKDIRSAVTMMCVMAAMLSTATYAWFTMSDSATVTGLEMTAKTSDGLLVSTDQKEWASAIDLRADGEEVEALEATTVISSTLVNALDVSGNAVLSPNFNEPVYSSDGYAVTALTAMQAGEKFNEKAIKKTFFIKEGSGNAVNVGIEVADLGAILTQVNAGVGLESGKPKVDGSFVALKGTNYTGTSATNDDAIEAVRIGFVIYNEDENGAAGTTELKIWEPNCDLGVLSTAKFATNDVGESNAALQATIASAYDGKIMEKSGDTYTAVNPETKTSDAFISIPAGAGGDGIRVDIFMWFEGQDPSCVNEIMADTVIGQLEFVAIP